jgi:hypothetical protein
MLYQAIKAIEGCLAEEQIGAQSGNGRIGSTIGRLPVKGMPATIGCSTTTCHILASFFIDAEAGTGVNDRTRRECLAALNSFLSTATRLLPATQHAGPPEYSITIRRHVQCARTC